MPTLSFIIPAYNEELFIGETLSSINDNVPKNITYEIVVIDHGSIDKTPDIAITQGANLLSLPGANSISALRNAGVEQSQGEYLIFLDADTALTPEWGQNIESTLKKIKNNPLLITGSKRVIPENSNWLNKAWFYSPRDYYSPTHLGGGHMIFTRELFNTIGGFPEDYETGEDFEICMRAKKLGARIVSFPELKAIHRGVPKTLQEFIFREIWHGRGDSKNLNLILSSTISRISIIFFLLHLFLLIALVNIAQNISLLVFIIILIAVICIGSSFMKTKTLKLSLITGNTLLFYFYYWSRFLSIISALIDKNNYKRSRHS